MEASDVAFLWQLLWLWVSPLLLPPDLLLLRLPALQGPQFQTFWSIHGQCCIKRANADSCPGTSPAPAAAAGGSGCTPRVLPRAASSDTTCFSTATIHQLKKTRHLPIYFIQAKKPSHRLCSVNGSTPLLTYTTIFLELRTAACMWINYSPAQRYTVYLPDLPTFPKPRRPKIQMLVYIVLDRYLHELLLLSPSLFRRHSRIKHQSIVPSHSQHSTPPAHRFYLSCSRTPS